MTWTEERLERLKTMWAAGHSAGRIAADLGGITRNAVIGKVCRLGLQKRTARVNPLAIANKAQPAPRRRSPSAPKMLETPIHSPANVPSPPLVPDLPEKKQPAKRAACPSGAPAAVMALTARTCRWPEGDVQSPDFRFCCAETILDSPYCATHHRSAFDFTSTARANRGAGRIARHLERTGEPQ